MVKVCEVDFVVDDMQVMFPKEMGFFYFHF